MLYPILTQSRCLVDLSGIWNFKLDNGNGFEEKWYENKLEDAMTMPVPASYNDLKDGIDFRDHYGWVFYQRNVAVPKAMTSERLLLRFAAVTHVAKVYLNGQLICEHKGGFLPFEAEVQELLKEGDNLLTVAVDNRIDHSTLPVGSEVPGGGMMSSLMGSDVGGKKKNVPNFDFFNYCGITRPVKLYTTPKEYIRDISLVSSVEGEAGTIKYQIDTVGEGDVRVEVFDEDGSLAAVSHGNTGTLVIEQVKLWQPLCAYLYEVKVTFGNDVYTLPYGVRTVRIDGNKFLINEKPFYFKGYGKHEDTYPAGRGLNMPMNVKDISLMKWQGANSFRTSHYPYSEEMMRLCDKEGIVVIDETTAVGVHLNFGGGANFKDGKRVSTFDPIEEGGIRTLEHHKDVVRDLIARDKNHACVVMWSIANEADSGSKGAYEYFKPLYDLARSEDPQGRPCTIVSVQMPNYQEDCTLKLSDMFCLNRYYGWYAHGGDLETAETALKKEMEFWNAQGKPFMFTEYGADTVSGFHDTVPVMYTEEYQIDYYKMNHRVVDAMENFVGEQVWNFADFATSQGILRVQGNKKGIFTRDRKPKMVAHYFKERWNQIPDFDYKK
ncbi:MAG: beta-glucuronidase [Lachnospiraceae bacterium]|nr:beta-glucuronidase [Lachnospiraceae bacterium]MDD3616376.1 beta-glucuronidase [Lachnospiraceae bacterium]